MSKLAIQGLLAITATLWLAQPVETVTPMTGSRNQINSEQVRDGDAVVDTLRATANRRGDENQQG